MHVGEFVGGRVQDPVNLDVSPTRSSGWPQSCPPHSSCDRLALSTSVRLILRAVGTVIADHPIADVAAPVSGVNR